MKLAFERPTVFIGKSVGLTVDRLDLHEYVRKVNENLNDDHEKTPWTYEQVNAAFHLRPKGGGGLMSLWIYGRSCGDKQEVRNRTEQIFFPTLKKAICL